MMDFALVWNKDKQLQYFTKKSNDNKTANEKTGNIVSRKSTHEISGLLASQHPFGRKFNYAFILRTSLIRTRMFWRSATFTIGEGRAERPRSQAIRPYPLDRSWNFS